MMVRSKSLRSACFAVLLLGFVSPVMAFVEDEAAHNWKGSARGSTKEVAGVGVDSFQGIGSPFDGFTGAGSHVLDPTTGHFEGDAVWTATTGATLKVHFFGDIAPSGNPVYPYSFKGQLKAHGGTGHLKHAHGTADWMGAYTGIPGDFFFVYDGNLEEADGFGKKDNFRLKGEVGFSNILAGTLPGGIVPYLGLGHSHLIGKDTQTGTIKNLTGLIPVDATTILFLGEVGPHPTLPGNPAIHLITTHEGTIKVTWTAVFTLKIVDATGSAIFTGDGDFKVLGGTGVYDEANGRFRTYFETGVLPPGVDQATANVIERGIIHKN